LERELYQEFLTCLVPFRGDGRPLWDTPQNADAVRRLTPLSGGKYDTRPRIRPAPQLAVLRGGKR
jgi:hypothetical protein